MVVGRVEGKVEIKTFCHFGTGGRGQNVLQIHLCNSFVKNVYLLTNISLNPSHPPHPPAPGSHRSTLWFYTTFGFF